MPRPARYFLVACAVFAAIAAVALTGPAFAQEEVPQPQLRRGAPAWLGFLIMFGMVAAVMLASLMPSKRGHQD